MVIEEDVLQKNKLVMLVYTYDPSAWEVDVGEAGGKASLSYTEFESCLGYLRNNNSNDKNRLER